MLNKIWLAMLVFGIVYGFGKGAWNSSLGYSAVKQVAAAEENSEIPPNQNAADHRNLLEMGKDLNAAALEGAKTSVEICIGLIGIMALWLGLMKIAEDSGLVGALAWLMQPLMRWLFPEIPKGHPAQGAILMNLSANMLGLDNAATPLGLKAMEELQTLNPHKDTATNSMAMFLAINTSSVTIIPFTLIGYRALKGSSDPVGPLIWIILSTFISTLVAIFVTRLLSKSPRFAVAETPTDDTLSGSEVSE